MILSITGGPDLSLAELEMIRQRFHKAARPGAHTAIGAAVLEDWKGRVALTVLAAEHWMPSTAPSSARQTLSSALFGHPEGAGQSTPAAGKRGKQGIMELDDNRGRFQDMAPTTYKGEDLDIPTYIRRGIRLPT